MISIKNFVKYKDNKFKNSRILKVLKKLLTENNEIINSFKTSYKEKFNKKFLAKLQKYKIISVIGMGGSILGSKAIYNFLKKKNDKKFIFIDNLNAKIKPEITKKKKLNLIISKSGNTLETILNFNIIGNKYDRNIFLTENNNSYLFKLANNLRSEIIYHNNLIGGRFSVLSEVGMLPAELMGLKKKSFKRLKNFINNTKYINSLLHSVSAQYHFIKNKKNNSVILNYDEHSTNLLYWYQQLAAESLGKKGKGLLPIISNMPKDNHSLMQSYLDGPKNNFFTFFYVKDDSSNRINDKQINKTHSFLKKKRLNQIIYSQFLATQKVFDQKKIPYRTFLIEKRNEETLGELFIFFMLEVILLGKVMNINPFNQPAVELIKKETIKLLKGI